MTPRVRLLIATALFVGWLGWLGYTALTKSRAPVVSRAQAAGASVAVLAEVDADDAGAPVAAAKVKESFSADGPTGTIVVSDLPRSSGFVGKGEYLLLLNRDAPDGVPAFRLAGQQRSPGADIADVGPPQIYPWTDKTADDLRKQVKRLFP